MPRRKKYDRKLPPVPVTGAMIAQLEYLSTLQSKSTNDLIRTAIREFLDNQGEIAGSRRWFTKAFASGDLVVTNNPFAGKQPKQPTAQPAHTEELPAEGFMTGDF